MTQKSGGAKFQILNDEIYHKGKYTNAIGRHFLDKDGKPQVWEMVERNNSYGRIVVIAPITPEGNLVLEKIYRLPMKRYTLELPAGLMDKNGESETEAAKRELLEETGYEAEKMIPLFAGPYNTGLTPDELSYFAGVNARKMRGQELESSEDIEIVEAPLNKLLEFLDEAEEKIGAKPDVKIAAVLPYLERLGLIK